MTGRDCERRVVKTLKGTLKFYFGFFYEVLKFFTALGLAAVVFVGISWLTCGSEEKLTAEFMHMGEKVSCLVYSYSTTRCGVTVSCRNGGRFECINGVEFK